jgi:GTPase SAR1 family protein
MAKRSRNVVLIGMTQNGKSSLIKEILKYGGKAEEAARVRVGDGNNSQTQECATYSVRVPTRRHFLRDIETKRTVEPTSDTDADTVEEYEAQLGGFVDLQIIDTPGLGESRNSQSTIADEDNAFPGNDGKPVCWRLDNKNMKTADERHKIGIIQALWEVGEIHAVCFVIKRKESFTDDLQRMIQSVQDIFRSASTNPWALEYHIIHTSVSSKERLAGDTAGREREFRQVFVGMRSTHHFVDNRPDKEDPISCYFAKNALASLISTVTWGNDLSTRTLKYLKNGVHVATDTQLCNGLAILTKACESELSTARAEFRTEERRRDGYANLLESREATLAKTVSEIRMINGNTLVECGSYTKTATTWGECWNGLEICVVSVGRLPIKEVEYKSDPSSGYFSDIEEGPFSVTAKIRSKSGLSSQTGTIILKTYRRLKEAKRLEGLNEVKKTQEQERDEAERKLETAQKTVFSLKVSISKLERILKELEQARKLTQGKTFDTSGTSHSLYYFTTSASFAAAKGYGMFLTVPKTRLPNMKLSDATCIAEIKAKAHQQADILQARKAMLSALRETLASRTTLAEVLHSMAEKISVRYEAQKAQRNAVESATVTITPYSVSSPAARRVYAGIKESARIASDIIYQTEDTACAYLRQNALTFVAAHEKIARSQKKLQVAVAFEEHQIRRLVLWLEAADEVVGMIKSKELSLGAFVVVERALGLQIANPYLVLCLEVWQTRMAEEKV